MRIRGRARIGCLSWALVAVMSAAAPAAGQTPPVAATPAPLSAPAPVERVVGDGSPAGAPRILTRLLQDSFGDFRRLPSFATVSWLGIGAAVALAGHTVDHPVTSGMSASALDEPFDAGDRLGAYPIQLGGALATYAIGHVTGHPLVASVGSDLLRAQLLAKTLTVTLKASVKRTRPDGTPWSFPSGHTSASFASATVLQRNFGWKVGVPAYAVASYVAASRIQAGRHYLSDVAFGAAIGLVAGRTVTVGRGEHRWSLAPVVVPGGAALSFSLVGPPAAGRGPDTRH